MLFPQTNAGLAEQDILPLVRHSQFPAKGLLRSQSCFLEKVIMILRTRGNRLLLIALTWTTAPEKFARPILPPRATFLVRTIALDRKQYRTTRRGLLTDLGNGVNELAILHLVLS
jgi:hypothetical protein